MFLLLPWMFIGALVGYWASQKRGFPVAQGLIVGAILGILSPLMLLATSTDRICPHCAEAVKREAKVCKHCGRDLPPVVASAEIVRPPPAPMNPTLRRVLIGLAILAVVVGVIVFGFAVIVNLPIAWIRALGL